MPDAKVKVDFLIAGQGLSGSLLALELLKYTDKLRICDPDEVVTSSRIAAGIIHPITGRRLTKTWQADQLIPAAFRIYKEVQSRIGTDFFYPAKLVEIYLSNHHRNDWMGRSGDPLMASYIGEELVESDFQKSVIAPFGGITVLHSGWLDVAKFVDACRSYFKKRNLLIDGNINDDHVTIDNKEVKWKNILAQKLIFCNGYNGIQSHFFKSLPFLLSKGEIIEIETQEFLTHDVLNRGIYIVPIGENRYKVGSTFSWQELNQTPTQGAKDFLSYELKKITHIPFSILNHQAAIRPTTKDRRPFIGLHNTIPSLGIFNGMGTKGVMMAPFYAEQFVQHLLFNGLLNEEVSITRFPH